MYKRNANDTRGNPDSWQVLAPMEIVESQKQELPQQQKTWEAISSYARLIADKKIESKKHQDFKCCRKGYANPKKDIREICDNDRDNKEKNARFFQKKKRAIFQNVLPIILCHCSQRQEEFLLRQKPNLLFQKGLSVLTRSFSRRQGHAVLTRVVSFRKISRRINNSK